MIKTTNNVPVLSKQEAYEYLDRAEQLLSVPSPREYCIVPLPHSWIQGMLAVDKDGHSCPPESDLAVAYCEIGAVMAVTHYDEAPDAAYKYIVSCLHAANPVAISRVSGAYEIGGIPVVNDNTTFEHVIKMFERAKQWVMKHG